MNILHQIEKILSETSFYETGYVNISNLKYYPEVRKICEGNGCGKYGTSWACPPATGTIEECRERVNKYEKMLLFSNKYDLEDSFDFEGMMECGRDFRNIVNRFNEKIKDVLSDYILLSIEGCAECKECTYPNAPCRFPELLHHSLEGYGLIVNEVAVEAGMRYNNGVNTVTYFGALLFNCRGKECDERK